MMQINIFLGNILLPVIWMALTGVFTFENFVVGFALSSICLWLISPAGDVAILRYAHRLYRLIGFLAFFIWELILANLRVAYYVLMPDYRMRSAIVAIPLDIQTDLEITVLANLITLTPGTLSLDVSPDRKTLFVHTMYLIDADSFRREIKVQYERRVMEVFE